MVASLTLPALVGKYKEKILVTQVKKSYSELQNGLKMYAARHSCSDILCISDTNSTTEELNRKLYVQFNGAKFCSKKQLPQCPNNAVKATKPLNDGNGQTGYGDGFAPPYFISASGAAFKATQLNKCPFEYESNKRDPNGNYIDEDGDGEYDKITVTSNTCARIYIDANGPIKGPNQFGADVYRFNITSDGELTIDSQLKYALTEGKLKYTPYNVGVEIK